MLVFVQISKRPYKRHSADLRCLFTNKKGVDGYEELLMIKCHQHCLIVTVDWHVILT